MFPLKILNKPLVPCWQKNEVDSWDHPSKETLIWVSSDFRLKSNASFKSVREKDFVPELMEHLLQKTHNYIFGWKICDFLFWYIPFETQQAVFTTSISSGNRTPELSFAFRVCDVVQRNPRDKCAPSWSSSKNIPAFSRESQKQPLCVSFIKFNPSKIFKTGILSSPVHISLVSMSTKTSTRLYRWLNFCRPEHRIPKSSPSSLTHHSPIPPPKPGWPNWVAKLGGQGQVSPGFTNLANVIGMWKLKKTFKVIRPFGDQFEKIWDGDHDFSPNLGRLVVMHRP